MKFLCGNCRTKYQISDDKVQGKILTIRCKSCGRKMQLQASLVTPQASVPLAPVLPAEQPEDPTSALATAFKAQMAAEASEAPEPMLTSVAPVPADLQAAGVEWYVAIDGQQHGPFAYPELVQQVRSRELAGRHYVWHEGMSTWQRVRLLPDLARYLDGSHAPPPVVEPPPGEEPTDAEPTAFEPAPTPALGPGALEGALEPSPTGEEATALMAPPPLGDTQQDPVLDPASAEPPGGSDTEAFRAVAGGDPDDIELLFEHLPREARSAPPSPSGAHLDLPEGHEDPRRRWSLGLALMVGVFLFGVAWATGWLSIGAPRGPTPAPRVGAAGAQGDGPRAGGRAAADRDLSERSQAGQVQGWDGAPPAEGDAEAPGAPEAPVGLAPAGAAEAPVDINPADPVEASEAPGDPDPKGAAPAEAEATGAEAAGAPVAPQPDRGDDRGAAGAAGGDRSFDPAAVRRIIKARRPSIRSCYGRSLKRRTQLRGKLMVRLRIQPSGRVSRAQPRPRRFARSAMGRCVAERMKQWVFPRFTGEAEEISVPVVLERS